MSLVPQGDELKCSFDCEALKRNGRGPLEERPHLSRESEGALAALPLAPQSLAKERHSRTQRQRRASASRKGGVHSLELSV